MMLFFSFFSSIADLSHNPMKKNLILGTGRLKAGFWELGKKRIVAKVVAPLLFHSRASKE